MLNFRGLVLIAGCLAIAQTGGAAWADGSAARSRTKQLIIELDNIGQRQAQASGSSYAATNLSLPDGRQVRVLRSFSSNGLVVELPEEVSLEEANRIALEMSSRTGVVSVQPDKRFYPAITTPNDPEYAAGADSSTEPGQWHLFEPVAGIRMNEAWDLSTGLNSITVAVIDTGIISHRDLVGRQILQGYDFYSDLVNDNDGEPGRDADPTDPGDAVNAGDCGPGEPAEPSSWHGLAVTGVILARSDNSTDIAGIDFFAGLLPIRVLGRCGGDLSDVADAIRWAAGIPVDGVFNSNPADVINLSLSGDGSCSQAEQSAIDDAVAAGSVIVVAAGNDGANVADISPANCDNVIVAGAIARDGEIASYTNVGLAVDLTAPGGDSSDDVSNILTLFNTGTTVQMGDALAYVQGTSFTAAQVSGVASLMLSRNGALTPAVLEDTIKATTRVFPPGNSCDQALCGTGVLNARSALIVAGDTTSIEANQAPIADAGGTYSGNVDDDIIFDGSGSSDPDGGPGALTYAWDFGDGNFGTGVSPTHVYDAGGTYSVLLAVNDSSKDSEISASTATIDDGSITANTGSGGSCTMHTAHSGKTDLLLWLAFAVFAGRLSVWRKLL